MECIVEDDAQQGCSLCYSCCEKVVVSCEPSCLSDMCWGAGLIFFSGIDVLKNEIWRDVIDSILGIKLFFFSHGRSRINLFYTLFKYR